MTWTLEPLLVLCVVALVGGARPGQSPVLAIASLLIVVAQGALAWAREGWAEG